MTSSRTGSPAERVVNNPPAPSGRALEVRGLCKVFSEGPDAVTALESLSLQAFDGEFVTVIGPSGCGKSTIFNIVSGLETADQGEVLLRDERLAGETGVVGYMPQRDLLLPWRTILNNVVLGVELQNGDKRAAKAEALKLFPQFGLEGFESRYPAELSGGMRQRAALLRTILTGHDVLLLDEPFGALDALTRLEMQEWLLSIWRRFGKTIVFITHDVEEAVFLSDRVYVLTRRPGTVKLESKIDLPRPRTRETIVDGEFVRAKHELLSALLEESTSS